MKKTLICFVLLLSVFIVSCTEETTTVTTTVMTTEEETTYDNSNYLELSQKLDLFEIAFLFASGIIVEYDTEVNIHMGSSGQSDISTSEAISLYALIDSENEYQYMEVNMGDQFDQVLIVDVEDEQAVATSIMDRRMSKEIVLPDQSDEGISNSIDFIYGENTFDALTPSYRRYTKIGEDYYVCVMSLQDLMGVMPELFNEMDDVVGGIVDFSEIRVEVVYQFASQDFDFILNVSIDPVQIIDVSNSFGSMEMSMKIKLLTTVEKVEIDYEAYRLEGPNDPFSYMFTFSGEYDPTLYLYPQRYNYYKYFFEAGSHYVEGIDSEFIEVFIYDEELNPIQGVAMFLIPEPGYYYVNYSNTGEAPIITSPDINLIYD